VGASRPRLGGGAGRLRGSSAAFEIGQAERSRRLELGISQSELARRAGMTQSAVSRLEAGQAVPTIGVLERLVAPLNAELPTQLNRRAWPGPRSPRQRSGCFARCNRPPARVVDEIERFLTTRALTATTTGRPPWTSPPAASRNHLDGDLRWRHAADGGQSGYGPAGSHPPATPRPSRPIPERPRLPHRTPEIGS
jgi:transcriptional regulator with XRE-family HTH domain